MRTRARVGQPSGPHNVVRSRCHLSELVLKRTSASRPSGAWNDDDFDVLADGAVVGRIMKVHAAPVGSPWMWTLAFGHHEDFTPTHGYAATREDAMSAFAKKLAAGMNDQKTPHLSAPHRRRQAHDASRSKAPS